MSTVVQILSFVLILMGLILVHEWGHLYAAKRCGMRVERFSIFFGRPIVRFQRGETEYGIGWLPLGGYVKITGMSRDEEIPPELVPRAYYAAPTWKKIVTIAAGPAVNLVVAVLCFIVFFWIGPPTALVSSAVDRVETGTPAAAIGLAPGDRIVSVNGERAADGDVAAVRDELRSSPGETVAVVYERPNGDRVRREVALRAVRDGDATVGQLGFNFAVRDGPRESSGFFGGIADGSRYTWFLVEENAKGIGRLFTSSEAREEIGSIVGAGAVYTEISSDGPLTVLRFIGFISLVLAIFNLLPIFPLDGGHILFAIIERIKGSPISTAWTQRFAVVGWAVILLVFVFALQNDIVRLTGEGFTR